MCVSNWSLGRNTRQLQVLSASCNGERAGETRGGFLVDVSGVSFLLRVFDDVMPCLGRLTSYAWSTHTDLPFSLF